MTSSNLLPLWSVKAKIDPPSHLSVSHLPHLELVVLVQVTLQSKGLKSFKECEFVFGCHTNFVIYPACKRITCLCARTSHCIAAGISLAFNFFCSQFRNRIFKIIQTRPKDYINKTGKKFWSGHKRFPRVVNWNGSKEEQQLSAAYIFSCANLYAYALRVKQIFDFSTFNELIMSLKLSTEEWNPSMSDTSMEVENEDNDDGEEDKVIGQDKSKISTWRAFLADQSTANLMPVRVTKFEKDDDDNHHVDFITHAANLRSWNYKIASSTRHQVRVVAGKILPALVTTTAMITGLQTLEFCKLMMGLQFTNQSAFRGWNINLATGTFNSYNATDPPAVRHGLPPLGTQKESDLIHTEKVVIGGREKILEVQHKAYPPGWTGWDKLICNAGNLTGPQFAEWMRKYQGFGIITECIYCAGFSLWNSALGPDSIEHNVPLAAIFAHKLASGARKQGQGVLRVQKMLTMLNRNPEYGVTVKPVDGDLFDLHVILTGPKGTPYDGGKFHISVKLPFTYPNAAPKVRFLTKIYHINIDSNGVPCPGQIGLSNWSPANTIAGLLRNIADKLGDPDATVPRYDAVKGVNDLLRLFPLRLPKCMHFITGRVRQGPRRVFPSGS